MSNNKKWNIKNQLELYASGINKLADSLGILYATAVLLYNRGLCDIDSASRFLKKETELFHDAFLLTDMDKAVKRIEAALQNNDKIVIYGDYDVDGVTSVSALYLYLKSRNADVGYYIPNRVGEGYGINTAAVETLAKSGVNLMITVDTGITANAETAYARSIGMDVIVTDHHECHANLPEASAVVNPHRSDCHYPFTELAGVGVVFKLLCALEKSNGNSDYLRTICEGYGDLVAIGTVADVMPLVDENRLIVSIGLNLIEHTKRPGLLALLEQSGAIQSSKSSRYTKKRKITSSLIGYVIAPRINAAGRISNASRAVELFLTDSSENADKIANELCETNRERQTEENNIIAQAYDKIAKEHDFEKDLVIVLSEYNWHHGVIGIVSSRITEHFNLPSILISFEDGGIGKGSGRSIKGMNLVEALKSCDDCLVKYGGHELAAGLSIDKDKLEEFKLRINEYARQHLTDDDLYTSITIDCELSIKDISLKLANELYMLEPYGIANPVPVFLIRDVQISEITSIGSNRHTKFTILKDNVSLTAIYFGAVASELDYCVGDKVDIVFNIDINDFQNVQTVQVIVRDMMHSESYKDSLNEQNELYNAIKEGKHLISKDETVIPSRDDFANIYLYIKREIRSGREIFTIHSLERQLGGIDNEHYAKVRFIIDILNETNILCAEKLSDAPDSYSFKLNYIKNKINLDKSSIYKKLKSRQEKS